VRSEQPATANPSENPHEKPGSPRESAGALLALLNVVLAGCALIPFVLEHSITPAFAAMEILGAFGLLYGMGAMIAVAAIGKAGPIVCVPFLTVACILLAAMLWARRLPWWAKLFTAVIEVWAFAVMFRTVDRLHMEYLRGAFRGIIS
jgi:hypothetical protein